MAKYYGVRKGRRSGIYASWEDCQDQVSGYSGAEFKSFKFKEDAEDYVYGRKKQGREASPEYKAYVDGSYDNERQVFAWGIVFLTPDGKEEFSGSERNSFSSHRNVAGEVYGAAHAVKLALDRGYDQLTIYHDYAGIRHWALGEWKRNNDMTKGYHNFMQEALDKIEIDFVKVKAHSGDVYNDRADELAREALKGGS